MLEPTHIPYLTHSIYSLILRQGIPSWVVTLPGEENMPPYDNLISRISGDGMSACMLRGGIYTH